MVNYEREDDERLLELAAGDVRAFTVFYRRYEGVVLGYFMRRVRDPELAADLAGETFAALLAGLRRFRADRGTASTWLFTIAERQLITSLRRRTVADRARRRLGMGAIELTEDDLARIERLGEAERVMQLLADLPANQREAVRARILDEREYGDIARELQCSPAVVRKRVSRGLSALRDQIEVT